MKRIPIIIIISSTLIAFIPVLGFILVAHSKMIPVSEFSRIISHYNIFQLLFNVFLIAVAIGMLRIQKWSFISFIVLGVCFLIYSIILISLSLLGLSSYEFHVFDYTILLVIISVLFASLAYIIRKELSMPYFSILGRGWRLSRRESLPIKIEWNNDLGQKGYCLTENISSKGCLLPLTESMEIIFLPYTEIEIKLYFYENHILKVIPVIGTILRIEETLPVVLNQEAIAKAGIIFKYVNGRKDEKWVSNFLDEKYSARYATDLIASLIQNDITMSTRLFNLSRTGMYLIRDEMLPEKTEVIVEFNTNFGRVSCNAQVVWTNPKGLYDKPPGMGIQILKVHQYIKFTIYLFYLAYLDEVRR
ncbi:MAG: PilZ domain-containing protein [Leptospiraceae bacterium]|nr:PilZ domain-containing protein [Leptospiraceae bacterium]